MARWSRAARKLNLPPGSRVLDLGCAFGFGTRFLTRKYKAFGHDLSSDYVEKARKKVPNAVFTLGHAEEVPYPDSFFDGVLLLDVLEHVRDDESVIREIKRILRPGGKLIISVPNKGSLAFLDSLNVYTNIPGNETPPPTDDPSWAAFPLHRHYSLTDLEDMLGAAFRVNSANYSGIGIAEVVNLALLLVFRRLLSLPRLCDWLQYLYFSAYLLEDLIPTGKRGYHLMVDAEKV